MASIIKVDTIQTAAGGTPTAADLGLNTTGSVLQTQTAFWTTSTTTSSSGVKFDIGDSVSITPSSASSKILIVTEVGTYFNNGNSTTYPQMTTAIVRDSTTLKSQNSVYTDARGGGTVFGQTLVRTVMNFLDSPNTTDQLTYKIQMQNDDVSGGPHTGGNEEGGSIILMEIAG